MEPKYYRVVFCHIDGEVRGVGAANYSPERAVYMARGIFRRERSELGGHQTGVPISRRQMKADKTP